MDLTVIELGVSVGTILVLGGAAYADLRGGIKALRETNIRVEKKLDKINGCMDEHTDELTGHHGRISTLEERSRWDGNDRRTRKDGLR